MTTATINIKTYQKYTPVRLVRAELLKALRNAEWDYNCQTGNAVTKILGHQFVVKEFRYSDGALADIGYFIDGHRITEATIKDYGDYTYYIKKALKKSAGV